MGCEDQTTFLTFCALSRKRSPQLASAELSKNVHGRWQRRPRRTAELRALTYGLDGSGAPLMWGATLAATSTFRLIVTSRAVRLSYCMVSAGARLPSFEG